MWLKMICDGMHYGCAFAGSLDAIFLSVVGRFPELLIICSVRRLALCSACDGDRLKRMKNEVSYAMTRNAEPSLRRSFCSVGLKKGWICDKMITVYLRTGVCRC